MKILLDIAVNVALITFGASADSNAGEMVQLEDQDRSRTPIYVMENNEQTNEVFQFGVDVDQSQLDKFSRYVWNANNGDPGKWHQTILSDSFIDGIIC